MPLFEYYCADCNAKFELLVSHKHANDIVCMKCQSEKVRRLLSVFAAPHARASSGDFDEAASDGECGCGGGGPCGCM